jgi:bla regulator protein blaR1
MNPGFSDIVITAISITLLHSLWQGLLIFLGLKGILTFIPSTRSLLRYTCCTISLALVFISSVVTFHMAYEPAADEVLMNRPDHKEAFISQMLSSSTEPGIGKFAGAIARYDSYIVIGWLAGLSLFLLRLALGWYLLNRIRKTASLLSNGVAIQLKELAKQMSIGVSISLGESAKIAAPMVIGILKPMVLLPAGLCAGLSSSQVEAILIHELAHIRRHDFLLNVLQSILESIYFFNPFTWMISSLMRSEREHCCDDAVVKYGVDAKSYAYALASLEELKLSSTPLAVSLLGNKNELLQRIKRLMEKSVTTYPLREKFLPVLLLLIGLLCASWFTIPKNDPSVYRPSNVKEVPQDTVIKKKNNSNRNGRRRKEVTVTPDRADKERSVKEYDRNESPWPIVDNFPAPAPMPHFEFDYAMATPPGIEGMMQAFSWNPVGVDTIPPPRFPHWGFEEFQQEFEQKFQEEFADFYTKNQDKIQEMMNELQQKYTAEQLEGLHSLEDRAREMEALARNMEEQSRHFEAHADRLKEFEFHMQWDEENNSRLRALDENMKKFEANMRVFESELREELIKDGYIKSSEKIEKIHWKDDGVIEINGKTIKDSDKAKYDALHEKYFDKQPGNFYFKE